MLKFVGNAPYARRVVSLLMPLFFVAVMIGFQSRPSFAFAELLIRDASDQLVVRDQLTPDGGSTVIQGSTCCGFSYFPGAVTSFDFTMSDGSGLFFDTLISGSAINFRTSTHSTSLPLPMHVTVGSSFTEITSLLTNAGIFTNGRYYARIVPDGIEAPEPASLAGLAVGSVILVAAKRRRSRRLQA